SHLHEAAAAAGQQPAHGNGRLECLGVSLLGFFFQAEDGIRDYKVTGVQTCALPISNIASAACRRRRTFSTTRSRFSGTDAISNRSEEHTSELQSPCNLVCRLLLEKKKKKKKTNKLL